MPISTSAFQMCSFNSRFIPILGVKIGIVIKYFVMISIDQFAEKKHVFFNLSYFILGKSA